MRAGLSGVIRSHAVDPKLLSGCVGAYEAENNSGSTDGSVWHDLTVNGNDWTQSIAGQKPIYTASSVANRPAWRSDGTKCFQGGPSLSSAKTVIFVAEMTVVPAVGTTYTPYSIKGVGVFSDFLFSALGGAYLNYTMADDFTSVTGRGYPGVLDTSPHIYTHTYNGNGNTTNANYQEFLDRTSETVAASSAVGRTATDLGSLFARVSAGGGIGLSQMQGDIPCVYIFNRVPTSLEILWGNMFLSTKYKIAIH